MTNMPERQVRPIPHEPHVLRFGEPSRLRVMVAKSGWPAYQIAAMAGLSPTIMSRYLNRRDKIRPAHLERLCNALGCEAEDIVEPVVIRDE